jgi:hypothetical protein
MATLFWIVLICGLLPLAIAVVRLPPARSPLPSATTLASSALLCTLAFNLTFFWQELWLVLSKAMVPGLHPILYHNNHEWTGASRFVELLQGAGAIATLISGLIYLLVLTRLRTGSGTLRLFVAWMAFEGLFQSLSQAVIGAIIPGNDVGRAFTFLGLAGAARRVALVDAAFCMAGAGILIARHWPRFTRTAEPRADRGDMLAILLPVAASILLSIPFRVPRDPIEVVLIPAVVSILGAGWTSFGMSISGGARGEACAPPRMMLPLVALLAVLAAFQIVLSRGIVV